ncbi:MAG: EVE domain-containing protein [Planctomycetes bacterium]|nr:EVE domain-containing protein [Planctomycetota bacterium]
MAKKPNRWLVKSDPEEYSWQRLEADGITVWDGVTNPLALIHVRSIRSGDPVLVYHTGRDKAIVGIAQAATGAYPDPKQGDPKLVVFDVQPVRALPKLVSLSAIKAERKLANWELVRLGRLSVMPVTEAQWAEVMRMAGA